MRIAAMSLPAVLLALVPAMRAQPAQPSVSPYLGSAREAAATAGELRLGLGEAIGRGLEYNLGVALSGQGVRSARAARLEALVQLLPNLSAQVGAAEQQVNLAAFGFKGLPGINPIVGPFGLVDARVYLSQTIFSLRALDGVRAGSEEVRAADFALRDSRDVVALVVTDLYLDALAGSSRIDAAHAQAATAEALYRQAVEFKRNGVVPAIDVIRAQVEWQGQQQRVIAAENDFEKAKLRLGRAIGLPGGQAMRLTDALPFSPQPGLGVEEALRRALGLRMDYQAAESRVRAAGLTRKAAAAGRMPSLGFRGDYGAIGPAPDNSHGTFSASIFVNVPIFAGGRVRSEVLAADAQVERRKAEAADLRGRIAFEIRSALLDLTASGQQVEVARSALALAGQQVEQARDRFAAGVTNNVEVVQAQQALAAANENYIAGLYAYNTAKAAFGRAVGGAEKTIPSLLLGGTL